MINLEVKKSVRETFGRKLVELGSKYSNLVVLDADLAASTQTKLFAKTYPERFFDVGIAEQDLVATASGLALTGKIPVAAAFAVFITGRAYDQVRMSVCYQKANVKLIGTHGGVTVGEDGATHQALEDVSLMRELPGMNVIVPADCNECEQVIEYCVANEGAFYIRISRNSLPDIYPEDYKFNLGKAFVLKEGKDVTLISNGDVLAEIVKAAEILSGRNIDAEVISLPVVKPLDSDTIIKSAKKTGMVVTVENHSVNGGVGSAVCECLAENYPTRVLRIGINDVFGQSGNANELLKVYGLDSESIANRVMSVL